MPDRLIRDELLESERWLRLKDNADRLAFIALLLKADSYGNFSADSFRLMRLWRDFGINNEPHACKTLTELADADLVRLYEVDGKAYLHIPRFGQRARYFKRVFPISPWTIEHKQEVANNSPVYSQVRTAEEKRSEVKRSEVKRSEEKKRRAKKPGASAPVFVPPSWIPTEQWNAWIEMRKASKKPPTLFALQLAVAKLEELKAQGHAPSAVLAQSAFKCWTDLWPLKDNA